MPIDKKKIACGVAAKHSANLTSATIEYAHLTGRIELVATEYEVLRDEMLSMLPAYRHPTQNELTEYMIFFDSDCVDITGSGYQPPEFIEALEQRGVPGDLLAEVKKYVRESELRIIELAQCKDEIVELKTKFSDARRIYDEHRAKRPDVRNAFVVQSIGLSTGFAPKRVDAKKLYFDYVRFVRKKGLTRDRAVKEIQRAYALNSHNATVRFLNTHRKSLLEKWKLEHPSMYPEIKSRLKGLIPKKKE
jgi:hypothetical protein